MTSTDRRRHRRREAPSTPVHWGLLAVCLLLGGLAGAAALADRLSSANPEAALTIAPWHAGARVAQANALLQEDTARPLEAAEKLRRALQADPLVPQALLLLGQALDAAGDPAGAFASWDWAARVALRDGAAQAVLLERDLKGGRVDAALQRLDILLRGDPQNGATLLQKLSVLLSDRAFLEALTRQMEVAPPWRESMLKELARRAPQLDPVQALYWRLQRGTAPPSEDEMRPLLVRLVAEGRFEEAYIFWLESGRRDQRLKGEFLYNARFLAPPSNLLFDWTIDPTPGASVQIERTGARRTLAVDFFGSRLGFQNVSQWLLLPPGDYVFSGLELADGVVSDRGVRWRMACAGDLAGELATTPSLTGTVAWREFSVAFSVPPTCRAQRLVLEVPARVVLERVISGRVSFANLSLRAQSAAPP